MNNCYQTGEEQQWFQCYCEALTDLFLFNTNLFCLLLFHLWPNTGIKTGSLPFSKLQQMPFARQALGVRAGVPCVLPVTPKAPWRGKPPRELICWLMFSLSRHSFPIIGVFSWVWTTATELSQGSAVDCGPAQPLAAAWRQNDGRDLHSGGLRCPCVWPAVRGRFSGQSGGSQQAQSCGRCSSFANNAQGYTLSWS